MHPTLTERANAGLHHQVWQWLQQQPWYQPSLRVLDVGCGTGAWLARFAAEPQRPAGQGLMGIDMDKGQFKLEGVAHRCLNLDEGPPSHLGQFELVTALEIIEHLGNPGHLLQLAATHLLPGGHLLLSTPNIHALPARLRFLLTGRLPHFDAKSDATHIFPMYTDSWQRLVARYPFTQVECWSYPARYAATFGRPMRLLSALLSPLLPGTLPGDNLVWLLRRNAV